MRSVALSGMNRKFPAAPCLEGLQLGTFREQRRDALGGEVSVVSKLQAGQISSVQRNRLKAPIGEKRTTFCIGALR